MKKASHKIDPRSIMPAPTVCRFCHSDVEYTTHAKIYGGRTFSDWPYIYLCTNPACMASVGVHPGTNHPLGTLADKTTKDARKLAHSQFDPLWKDGMMKRGEAYKWLAGELGIERWRCHIGWLDTNLALKVASLSADKWFEIRARQDSGSH